MSDNMDQQSEIETLELGVKSAKVASLVGMTQLLSILIGGVTLIVLARLLLPTEYGIYTLAYSVSVLFSAFGLSGIGHYLNKYIPFWTARRKKDDLSRDLGASFAVLIGISLAATAVGVAFSGVISQYVFHSTAYISLIDLALATIVFTQLMYLAYNALIGFKDGVGSALTYSTGNIFTSIASIALVVTGFGAYGAIAGVLVGAVCSIAVGAFFITRHSSIRLTAGDIGARAKRILGFSMPIAGASIISSFMSSFSILLLGIFSSAALVGSFGVAYRIGTIATTATAFIGSVLVQMFASALETRKAREKLGRLYNYSIYFGAVVAAPIAVYLIVLAHPFVISLFPEYTSSLLYTPALTISLLIGTVGSYALALAISMGEVRRVLKYTVITGIVQFALLLALVPLINAYGVIVAVYLAGSLMSNYLYMRYMRVEKKIKTELGKVYRVIVASLVLAVFLAPVTLAPISETLQLAAGIIVVIVLYPILLGMTRSMGEGEMHLLREFGKSTPVVGRMIVAIASYVSYFSR